MKEILYLSVTNDHPLAECKEIYLKDLKDLTLILHSRIGFWYDLCKEKMIRPNFILQEDFDQAYLPDTSFSIYPGTSILCGQCAVHWPHPMHEAGPCSA